MRASGPAFTVTVCCTLSTQPLFVRTTSVTVYVHAVVHGKLRIRLRIYVYITAVGLHAARCGGHRKCDRISSGSCIPVFRICRLRGGAVTKIPLVAEAAA